MSGTARARRRRWRDVVPVRRAFSLPRFFPVLLAALFAAGAGAACAQPGLPSWPSPAFRPYNGAGMVTSDDGISGYFVVGVFDTEKECVENVHKMGALMVSEAGRIDRNIQYRFSHCAQEYENGSLYQRLHALRDVGHYAMLHTNIRIAFVSRQPAALEEKACRLMGQYFEYLLGGKAACRFVP